MEITKVYALDAVFDSPEDVPEDVILTNTTHFYLCFFTKAIKLLIIFFFSMQIKANKRYAGSSNWTVKVQLLIFITCVEYGHSVKSYFYNTKLKRSIIALI